MVTPRNCGVSDVPAPIGTNAPPVPVELINKDGGIVTEELVSSRVNLFEVVASCPSRAFAAC